MALYRLLQSPNLLKINLDDFSYSCGVRVTPELFWPQLEEFQGQKPFWPSLQSITVLISWLSPDGTLRYVPDYVFCHRLKMTEINPLFMAAAQAAQYMPKLLEMRLKFPSLHHMKYPPCQMAFTAQDHCSKEDTEGYHAALRRAGIIYPDSEKLVLRSCQLDLSKPRVSVTLPSGCKIDSRLAQVWKTSKGEDVDYKVYSGFVSERRRRRR